MQILGGGNAANALTCTARLGLIPRLISKVAADSNGRNVLAELKSDGVDTSYVMISESGTSTVSFVIVDNHMKTRTCVYTPVYPPMVPHDLPRSTLLSALTEARLVFLDGRSLKTALVVAQEAAQLSIPILVEAEKVKSRLNSLFDFASYVICSEKFPQAWTSAPSIPSALVSILLRLPRIKFVIATLGEKGCVMIERSIVGSNPNTEAIDVEKLAESLQLRIDDSNAVPACLSSESNLSIHAEGIGTICGRLFLGTAETIPASELIDTTGAGDSFIGAVIYALCAGMPPERMLPFACKVAASCCKAIGARTGIPRRADPCLAPFLL